MTELPVPARYQRSLTQWTGRSAEPACGVAHEYALLRDQIIGSLAPDEDGVPTSGTPYGGTPCWNGSERRRARAGRSHSQSRARKPRSESGRERARLIDLPSTTDFASTRSWPRTPSRRGWSNLTSPPGNRTPWQRTPKPSGTGRRKPPSPAGGSSSRPRRSRGSPAAVPRGCRLLQGPRIVVVERGGPEGDGGSVGGHGRFGGSPNSMPLTS